jgi:hypothetical protein
MFVKARIRHIRTEAFSGQPLHRPIPQEESLHVVCLVAFPGGNPDQLGNNPTSQAKLRR